MQRDKKDPFENVLRRHLSSQSAAAPAERCPDENWMAAYLEDSLGSGQKAKFEGHLLNCDRCQAELAAVTRTEAASPAQLPQTEIVPDAKQGFFTLLIRWMNSAAFKPAFAVLAASLIVAWVGYRLLPRQTAWNSPTMEVAQQLPREEKSLEADKLQLESGERSTRVVPQESLPQPAVPASEDRSKREREGSSIEARLADSSAKNDDRARSELLKETYSAEPPTPKEVARDTSQALRARRDNTMPPTDTAAQKSSAQDLNKDLAAGQEQVSAQGAKPAQPAGEGLVVGALNRSAAQTKPAPVAAPASPAGLSAAGAGPEKKTEQDNEVRAADVKEAQSESRKQKASVDFRQVATITTPARQIFTGGKRFELRQGVWHDLSIVTDEALAPQELRVRTTEYESHRNALAPFQAVLARPEDVLIKLSGTVYRIRKRP